MPAKVVTLQEKLQKKFDGFKFNEDDCKVHDHNSYVPLEDHHIHPQGWHGPDSEENLIRLCSNGHGEVHYYLALLLATGKARIADATLSIPLNIRTHFGYKVKNYASAGFISIMSSTVTPEGLNVAS